MRLISHFIFGILTTFIGAESLNYCIVPPTVHIRYNNTCDNFLNISSPNNQINWAGMIGEAENIQLLISTASLTPYNITYRNFHIVTPTKKISLNHF